MAINVYFCVFLLFHNNIDCSLYLIVGHPILTYAVSFPDHVFSRRLYYVPLALHVLISLAGFVSRSNHCSRINGVCVWSKCWISKHGRWVCCAHLHGTYGMLSSYSSNRANLAEYTALVIMLFNSWWRNVARDVHTELYSSFRSSPSFQRAREYPFSGFLRTILFIFLLSYMSAVAIDGLYCECRSVYRCVFGRWCAILLGIFVIVIVVVVVNALVVSWGGAVAVDSWVECWHEVPLNLYFVPRQHASCYCNKMDYRSELLVPDTYVENYMCIIRRLARSLAICKEQRREAHDGRIIRWDLELTMNFFTSISVTYMLVR